MLRTSHIRTPHLPASHLSRFYHHIRETLSLLASHHVPFPTVALASIVTLHTLPHIPAPKSLARARFDVPRRPNRILAVGIRIGDAVRTEETITGDFQAAKGVYVTVTRAGGPVGGLDLVAAGAGADFDAFAIGLAGSAAAVGGERRGGGQNEGQEGEDGLEKHVWFM